MNFPVKSRVMDIIAGEDLLDKNEARKALGGIGTTKFYEILNSGELKGVKIGKRLMIRRSEIARYISLLPAYKSQ